MPFFFKKDSEADTLTFTDLVSDLSQLSKEHDTLESFKVAKSLLDEIKVRDSGQQSRRREVPPGLDIRVVGRVEQGLSEMFGETSISRPMVRYKEMLLANESVGLSDRN